MWYYCTVTCEGYYSKMRDHEEGVHEEMPVAEQSPVTMQLIPAFKRFCSSIPFFPQRVRMKQPAVL